MAADARTGATRRSWRDYARAVGVVAAATLVASAVRAALRVPDVEMLFLLGVVIVAVTSGRGAAVTASVLSVAAYDFFFVPPPWTFDVEDARYVLTFAMMLGIAVLISTLTLRLREQERVAAQREERTAALYAVSRRLGSALVESDVAVACVDAVLAVVGTPSVFLLVRDDQLELVLSRSSGALTEREARVASWAALHGSAAGNGSGTFDEEPILCIPLRPVVDVLAVLAIRTPERAGLSAEQREFAEAVCRQGALALERIRLADEARRAALRAEAERLRSTLLSSVSHDLRTPLSVITGAATTLRAEVDLPPPARQELLDSVCEEAERLERLVGDLLDMTRLESGAVRPKRDWVPLVEVVGGALTRLDRQLAGRDVTTDLPEALPLLSLDPVLVEQLLVNVLENAVEHTPPGSPIAISASSSGASVVLDVADRGPGIPRDEQERVFERFRRGPGATGGGVGLGLAIARAIATAHGGTLAVSDRLGGGSVFRLTLPAGNPPELPLEETS